MARLIGDLLDASMVATRQRSHYCRRAPVDGAISLAPAYARALIDFDAAQHSGMNAGIDRGPRSLSE
jgi:hypothetical protein